MKKMRRATVAAVASAALFLSACSGSADAEGTGDGDAVVPLSVGNFLDLTNWDPALADLGFDGPYLSAVYDPLVTIDDDAEPQPGIATDWEISEDFLTVTFNIRTDAEFSDGTPVNADTVVQSLEHLKEGALSQEAYLKVDSIEAEDDDTVVFHMTERDDTMLYLMGLGRSYLASPEAIEADTLSAEPVGSGPYTLNASSVPGTEYNFDKVEDHWDSEEFPFSPLTVMPLSDNSAMLNAMEAGQLNVIYTDYTGRDLAEDNDWNVSQGLAMWQGLQFADRTGDAGSPFGDKKVRQALNYAFDTQAMNESIAQGEGRITNQVFAVDTPGHLDELNDMYEYDMDKAKELLAEAGYEDGFEVTMPMAPPFQPWQAIIEQTFDELNIDVSFEETDFTSYMTKAPDYPAYVGVVAMEANPVAAVERQISKRQWYNPNPGLESFPEVQDAVETVFEAQPGDDQIAAVEEVNMLVTEEAFFSVFGQSENTYVSSEEFTVDPVIGLMFPTLRHINLHD